MRGKRILLISPEPWGVNWVSKHHYAAQLGKLGSTVYFLSPQTEVSKDEVAPGVHLLAAPKIARGVRYFPGPLRRAYHRKLGRELVRAAGGSFDLVWSFEASCYLDLDCLSPGAKTIFFLADGNDRLPWRIVAESADLCLSVCHALVDELQKVSANAHFIHHGHSAQEPLEYRFETPGPNIVYAGSLLHKAFDRERVRNLIRAHPQCHFHFFGETGQTNLGQDRPEPFVDELRSYPKCFVHGSVPANRLSGIYQAADVLLLPYFTGEQRPNNSHKMMEYLASGTPILSTRLAEYEEISDALLMLDSEADFVEGLKIALEYDDPSNRDRRISFAVENSYGRQLERILHKALREKPQKVLHIAGWYPTDSDSFSGIFVSRHIEALSRSFEQKVWHIEVKVGEDFQLETNSRFADRVFKLTIPIRFYRLTEWISFLAVSFFWLVAGRRSGFQAVNFHIAYPNCVSLRVLKWIFGHRPVFITEHWSAYHFNFHTKLEKLGRTRQIFHEPDGILVVSEALKRDLISFSGCQPEHIWTVPNVVDSEIFFDSPQSEPEPGRFVCIGRLDWPKRQDVLIESLLELISRGHSAYLTIVGEGPQLKSLQDRVSELSLQDRVSFIGARPAEEIAKLLRKTHALLHCSDYETFSAVCAEAHCCGTPVIASKVGGVPEVVDPSAGTLIEGIDSATWADAIEKCWQAYLEIDRASVARKNQERFSPETVGREYARVLRMGMAKSRGES